MHAHTRTHAQTNHHQSAWHVSRIIGNGLAKYSLHVRCACCIELKWLLLLLLRCTFWHMCLCAFENEVLLLLSRWFVAHPLSQSVSRSPMPWPMYLTVSCWIFHMSCGIYHLISCEKVIYFVFYCNAKANNCVFYAKRQRQREWDTHTDSKTASGMPLSASLYALLLFLFSLAGLFGTQSLLQFEMICS